MAFLQASPTSTTRPICTKMSTSPWVNSTPATEQSRHSGTTRMTASGSDQLSYRAARARKTHTTARAKTYMAVLPARICMNMISVHSACMEIGSVSRRQVVDLLDGVAGADARRQVAGDGRGGVEVVARDVDRAADLAQR